MHITITAKTRLHNAFSKITPYAWDILQFKTNHRPNLTPIPSPCVCPRPVGPTSEVSLAVSSPPHHCPQAHRRPDCLPLGSTRHPILLYSWCTRRVTPSRSTARRGTAAVDRVCAGLHRMKAGWVHAEVQACHSTIGPTCWETCRGMNTSTASVLLFATDLLSCLKLESHAGVAALLGAAFQSRF